MHNVGQQGAGEQLHVAITDVYETKDGSWAERPIAWCSRRKVYVLACSDDPKIYDLVSCDRCRAILAHGRYRMGLFQ